MAKFTKYLFIISISLSLVSFLLIKNGYKELYPFYSWKLFSVPSGNTSELQEFRLYGVKGNVVEKLNNTDSQLFDGNEKFSIINDYGNAILEKKEVPENKTKLLKFAQLIEPKFDSYYLVQETYKPEDLGKKSFKIDKKTIAILR